MRNAAGQVAREAHRVVHYALALFTVLLLGLAVLGWRLAQGPIEIAFLARAIENEVNTADSPSRLSIGEATIAWEGLRGEAMSPLDLRLTGVRLLGRDGALRAALPDAAVSLSIPWLLRGEIAPRRIELRNPVLRLRRAEDGRLSVQLARPDAEPSEEPAGNSVEDMLAELMKAPNDGSPLGALAAFSITGGQIMVEDAQLGAAWSLQDAAIELRRLAGGGVTGQGSAVARMGDGRLPVAVTAEAAGNPARLTLRATLPEVRPAALSQLVPAFAPLAGLDAPARVELSARLSGDGVLEQAGLRIAARAGAVDLGEGRRIPLNRLEATAEWTPAGLRVPRALVQLAGPATPVLTATADAARRDGRWHGSARLALDAAPLAELARWWPTGVGSGERAWILENVTAGTARNGNWEIEAEAPQDLSTFALKTLRGTLEVEDATVHWLRPIPPAERATGRVTFSPEEIAVRVATARQAGTQLQVKDAVIRIPFAPDGSATMDIQLGVAGPVPDAIAVLQQPRLHLFDRRPLPIKDPQGTLEGRVSIGFPLLADLAIEQLRIRATAQVRQFRMADVLMGRPLERGQFDLTVDTESLRVTGTGVLADIQARLGVEMDFRPGPANQVVMRETVQARADARQLAALGLAHEDVVRGPVGLDVRTERRRSGPARATVRADLREATLVLDALSWSKPPGQNAGAEAVLRMTGDSLDAIESFRIEAPSLLLRGNVAFGRGTRLDRVAITEARIEDSRFAGEARPPAQQGSPWTVSLRGAVLDLRRRMAEESAPGPVAAPAPPGPAISADARFERLLLGPQRELAGLEARVALDAHGVLREGRITGRAGANGPFDMTITPQGNDRAVRITAQNAGALLHSFDVLPHLEGGRLTVTGTFAGNARGATLTGEAEMDDFSVRNAPGFAKLLQAMTLFGLVEALSGPGLGFSRLVAPFTLTPDALVLDDARAFSASLGLTAKGTLDRRRHRVALEGTIVPAYILNSLLGNIPILGRIFSPERGGGLFAATYRLNGPLDDPAVSVNPLAALTPGFLRGIFGSSLPAAPQ
ncbi:AsmA-like C-terminal region-containing protein [Falsiroseomonas sp. HW251]|uniref:YhdP family protein n=1 Tax=Falsiroseomonas sp. HW251 TaxID=3390998 RepID=UPI003D320194